MIFVKGLDCYYVLSQENLQLFLWLIYQPQQDFQQQQMSFISELIKKQRYESTNAFQNTKINHSNKDIPPSELSSDMIKSNLVESNKKLPQPKANFFLTVMIIMKTIIGAGVLTLPYTISRLGYVFSIIIFAVVAGLSYFSTTLLIKAKNLSKHSNTETIFYFLHKNRIVVGLGPLLIVLKSIGLCTIQLAIFKESIRKMFQDFITNKQNLNQWYTSQLFIIFVIVAFEFPFAVMGKIEKFKKISFIGVLGIILFTICLLAHFIVQMSQRNWQVASTMRPFPKDWFTFASVVPNVLLALTFQANFFPIYKGMKNSNDQRITSASLTAIISCGAIYLITCVYTYMLYGEDLQANFLLSINKDTTNPFLYYGMNVGFLLSILFAYPIIFLSARNNSMNIAKLFISYYREKHPEKSQLIEESEHHAEHSAICSDKDYPIKIQSDILVDKKSQNQQVQAAKKRNQLILFYGLTGLIYVIIILLAILARDIEILVNIIGAVCSTTIGFLFPYYFYFTLTKKLQRKKNWIYYYTRVAFWVLIPIALFSIVVQNIPQ